jgi:3-oxoadipate enol-lactonase
MTAVPVARSSSGPDDAPVVLLSNSLGSTIHMWDPVLPRLTEHFRVVRYDTRGHGRSPVPPGPYELDDLVDDAIGVLDFLDVARAHIVGLSLGGMVSLRLAVLHPERVDRLGLLCTSAQLGPASGWAERAAAVRANGTGSIAASVVSRWITPATAAADPALIAGLEQMVADIPDEGYAACCGVIERMDQRADLPSVTAPTLAIAGADDPTTPPEHLQRIVAGIPGARLAVVANAAHVAPLERPDEIADLLLEHLTKG